MNRNLMDFSTDGDLMEAKMTQNFREFWTGNMHLVLSLLTVCIEVQIKVWLGQEL
jgi:hypothetical protein